VIATMVGNYPKIADRPGGQAYRQALHRLDRGEIDQAELARVAEAVTREVIDEQVRAGLDLLTDGMIRWEDNQTYFARRLEGVTLAGLIRYFDTNTYYRQPVIRGPIRWPGPITVDDWRFAAAYSPRPVKAILPGPYTLARLSRSEYYTDRRRLTLALAEAVNHEARALAAAGAPLIQIDEPAITWYKQDWPLCREALLRVAEGVGAPLALATWFGDVVGLEGFFALPFQVFSLDFVMGPRNWELVERFPADRTLGFGLLDARNIKLESVDYLIASLRRVARHVPLERLHVHPSCGLEYLPREYAYAKLERMVAALRGLGEEAA